MTCYIATIVTANLRDVDGCDSDEARAREMEADGEICTIVAITPPPTVYHDMAASFASGVPIIR